MKRLVVFGLLLMLLAASVTATSFLIKAPGDPVLLNNAGFEAYIAQDLELAEAFFLSAIAIDEAYEKSRYNLALLYVEQERYDDALPHLLRLLDFAPDNAQYHFDYAIAFVERFRQRDEASANDFDHAINEYLVVEQLLPGFPHATENAQILQQIKHEFFG